MIISEPPSESKLSSVGFTDNVVSGSSLSKIVISQLYCLSPSSVCAVNITVGLVTLIAVTHPVDRFTEA